MSTTDDHVDTVSVFTTNWDHRCLRNSLALLKECKKLSSTCTWLKINSHKILHQNTGICGNAELTANIVNKYFRSWPEFSGNIKFPVPYQDDCMFGYDVTQNKYDERTEYGRARHRLIDHMITCLETELAELGSDKSATLDLDGCITSEN